MNQRQIKIRNAFLWPRLIAVLSLGLAFNTYAQQGSQGNTMIFGGAEMTFFGTHNFVTGGTGTQPGIIKTARTSPFGILNFAGTATQTGANDANHVDGYVSKIGTTAFTFPVGNGTDLRTLGISAPSTAAEVTVAWFSGDPGSVTDPSDAAVHSRSSLASGVTSVSPAGFWDWMQVSGTFTGMTITASIPDLTSFAIATNLRLVGWNGTQWVDLSGSATATGNTEGSMITGTIPASGTITALALGSTEATLPVTLVSFMVQKTDNNKAANSALLRWATSSETNADRFEIERSLNGKSWNQIGTKAASSESSVLKNYSFTDEYPAPGENLYRLKLVDRDGSFAYSRIESLRFEESNAALVYPNPVADILNINAEKGKEIKQISLFTTSGQPVYSSGLTPANYVNVSGLPKGLYLISVAYKNGETKNSKVIVSR